MATVDEIAVPSTAGRAAGKAGREVTRVIVNTAPLDAHAITDKLSGTPTGTDGPMIGGQPHYTSSNALSLWLQNEPRWQRRATLPRPQQPAPKNINVWSLVKDFVGKGDLSKIATPVQLLEPLSELQQRCEDLEYTELLDQALAAEPQSLERLLLVTAFAVSAYSGVKRTQKPFNAFLGETCEFACPEKGFRFFAEKVQHEPTTINHVHVDGRGWAFNLEDELHTRFTGTSIDLMPIVLIRVAFADGDAYTWHKATTSILGVVMGPIRLEHKGTVTVRGCQSGYTANFKLHATGMLTSKSKMHEVSGTVEKDGVPIKGLKLKGKWDTELVAEMPDGSSRRLWTINPPAADPTRFGMTSWVLALNEMSPELERLLPPTDTRMRADIRALEQGRYDQAAEEHRRLLEEHEVRVKELIDRKAVHEPRWCERIMPDNQQIGKQYLYRYKGGYWEERAAKCTNS